MSIPTDFSPDDDPVLSDELLTPDDDTRRFIPEDEASSPTTRQQKAAELRYRKETTDFKGFGDGREVQEQMGIGIDTTVTRESVMQARTPPRNLQYSDLFRQGMPLNMGRAQPKEKYGARTQAALRTATRKDRFRGTPGVMSIGRKSPGSLDKHLQEAKDYPRDAHRDVTEHDLWRNLMEESPAHTQGAREAFDSLTSPRSSRAVNRAMRGGEPQVVMTEDLSVHTPAPTGWPGSIDPNTPNLPPPPAGRGRPRKQL